MILKTCILSDPKNFTEEVDLKYITRDLSRDAGYPPKLYFRCKNI